MNNECANWGQEEVVASCDYSRQSSLTTAIKRSPFGSKNVPGYHLCTIKVWEMTVTGKRLVSSRTHCYIPEVVFYACWWRQDNGHEPILSGTGCVLKYWKKSCVEWTMILAWHRLGVSTVFIRVDTDKQSVCSWFARKNTFCCCWSVFASECTPRGRLQPAPTCWQNTCRNTNFLGMFLIASTWKKNKWMRWRKIWESMIEIHT